MIVSPSGGKDSVAMLCRLADQFGAQHLLAHHQVLPEDRADTLPYVQCVCKRPVFDRLTHKAI